MVLSVEGEAMNRPPDASLVPAADGPQPHPRHGLLAHAHAIRRIHLRRSSTRRFLSNGFLRRGLPAAFFRTDFFFAMIQSPQKSTKRHEKERTLSREITRRDQSNSFCAFSCFSWPLIRNRQQLCQAQFRSLNPDPPPWPESSNLFE
jgi:hypothetical protein